MRADERFANTAGSLQGGFLSALADSAMGASAVTYARADPERRVYVANAEIKTSFIRPVAIGSELVCEARVISADEAVCYCEATIRDESGRLVGRASSTYLIAARP